MWFQTVLISSLSLLSYARHLLGIVARCQRQRRKTPAQTVYVRANTVEGLVTARLLKQQQVADIVLVEEDNLDDDLTVGVENVWVWTQVLQACGLDIEWTPKDAAAVPGDSEEEQEESAPQATGWTRLSASVPRRTASEKSTSTREVWLPTIGWPALKDQLRETLQTVEFVPGFDRVEVIDVREEEAPVLHDIDSTLLLSLCQIERLECQLLGEDFLWRQMMATRDA